MNKNFFHRFIIPAKILILLAILSAGFFNFGFIANTQALAPCEYTILRFDPEGKTQATATETLKFIINLKRLDKATTASEIGKCNSEVSYLDLTARDENGKLYDLSGTWTNYITKFAVSSTDPKTATYNTTISVPMKTFVPAVVTQQPPSSLTFSLKVFANDSRGSFVVTQTTWGVGMTYSGQTGGGSGDIQTILLTFNPSKQLYAKDDVVTVSASMKGNYYKLPSAVSRLRMETYVNDTRVGGDKYEFNKSELQSYSKDQVLPAIAAPPFTANSTIKVFFKDVTSGITVAQGESQMSVQGLTTASKPDLGDTTNTKPDIGSPTSPKPDLGGGGGTGGIDCTKMDKNSQEYINNCIYNPAPVDTLTDMLLLIMKGFLGITAVWAVTFIVIGGFKMVMSQGNEEAYTAARKTVTWAVLGLVIALLSFAIVAMVQNFLGTDIKPLETGQQNTNKIFNS